MKGKRELSLLLGCTGVGEAGERKKQAWLCPGLGRNEAVLHRPLSEIDKREN